MLSGRLRTKIVLTMLLLPACDSGTSKPAAATNSTPARGTMLEYSLYFPEGGQRQPYLSFTIPPSIAGRFGTLEVNLLDKEGQEIGHLSVTGNLDTDSILGAPLFAPCSRNVKSAQFAKFTDQDKSTDSQSDPHAMAALTDFYKSPILGSATITLKEPAITNYFLVATFVQRNNRVSIPFEVQKGSEAVDTNTRDLGKASAWTFRKIARLTTLSLQLCGEEVLLPSFQRVGTFPGKPLNLEAPSSKP